MEHPQAQGLALRSRWKQLQAEKKPRNRDAAQMLGVSEGELIASLCGAGVTRLRREPVEILREASMLGRVMALTRNESVVHERKGIYAPATAEGHIGLVLGDDIDLRLFFSQWKSAFAVTEEGDKGPKQSLQFFDGSGTAVHKIHLLAESDTMVFEAIADRFGDDDQSPTLEVAPRKPGAAELPDEQIETEAFREGWANLKDTHEFFGLMKRFGVTRTQALRLADREQATAVDNLATRRILEGAARSGTPIMVFVGNPGCIQIHTGPVSNIKVLGPWLNVLDPEFNLHLREDHITHSWVVKKPTTEGIVTSLEVFDEQGILLAQFFGKRKPGIPELEDWRALVAPEVSRAA